MTVLSELAPALQRELAVPGTFDDVFPDTTLGNLSDSLADAFGEAQLYGFFLDLALTINEDEEWETSEDLSAAGQALLLIFSSMRIIRAQLRALQTSERYKAGPTEFEIQRSANLLRDELAFLTQRLKDIIDQAARAARAASSSYVIDNYLARGGAITLGGLYPYEYRG